MPIHTTNKRCGLTLLECTAALAVLAAGLIMAAQVLAACVQNRRAGEQLLAVQLEAANVAEHIAAMPYQEFTKSAPERFTLSPGFQELLPGAHLKVTSVDSSESDLPHKRVKIEISWPAEEETARTFAVFVWKYPAAEAQP